jgi:hypothetical protein
MIAEQPKSPPGLPLTINFKIPADWTPEQALAVFELLDTSETKSARTTASSCSNSTANNTCTPAPIETTAMSTINRSEHHNLKGPKRALS